MKHLLLVTLIFISTISLAQTGTIQVKIQNIKSNQGFIQIGLFDKKEGFTEFDKTFLKISIPSNMDGVIHTFKNVPFNNYAIATWQDENNDKKINTNFFGVPTENYGFSLNKRGTFGPPDFEVVSFEISDNNIIKLIINLK